MSKTLVEIPRIGMGEQGECRSCKAQIAWAPLPKTGKPHPWNLDGTSHFSTCPDAARWRRSRS